MRRAVCAFHAFLIEQRFYSVALFVGAACVLLLGRWWASGSRTFAFMLFNLVLAVIPYVLSFVAAAVGRAPWRGRGVVIAALAVPWLAFLPNAPYLVTDLLHLRTATHVPVWYDVAMFASFAWSGCLIGVASLDTMRRLLAERVGALVAQVTALGVVGLCSLGIYLGRVVRLNSWDLVLRPRRVLLDIWTAAHSREAVLFTLLFAGFLAVCYVSLALPGWRPGLRAARR